MCPFDGDGGEEELELLSESSCIGTATYPITYEDFRLVSSTVIKVIKLKFIIVQNPNILYNGNFETSIETDKYFSDAMNDFKNCYANITTGSFCALPDTDDMKIQFDLASMEYYPDYTEDYC
jgi:hypothetical protein